MGVFATNENQFSYIYCQSSDLGKKVLGYIQSLEAEVQTINVSKDPLSDTVWTEVSEKIGVALGDLFTWKKENLKDIKNRNDLNTTGWLKMIKKNPELLQKPILIKDEKAIQINSRSDVLPFFGVDSAGLGKNKRHEHKTLSSQTENENFTPKNN